MLVMKKLIIASLLALAPLGASAQNSLVAGFNFGQFLGAGFASTNGATGDDGGSIGANWSNTTQPPLSSRGDSVFLLGTPGGYSSGTGRAYWDGTFGSSNVVGSTVVSPFNNVAPSINSTSPSWPNIALIGDHNGANMSLAVTESTTIGFSINTSMFNDTLNGLDLTFAARADAPITITWQVGNTVIGSPINVTSTMTAYNLNLPSSFYGAANSQISASFSGAGMFDNVQFVGTVIPEPSTYAALLGFMTLAVAGVRRRFAAKTV